MNRMPSRTRRYKRRRRLITGLLFVLFFLVCPFVYHSFANPPAGARSLAGPETGLTLDPLMYDILFREDRKAAPIIANRVEDKTMPSRTEAVEFFGLTGGREVLPALVKILKDSTNSDEMRAKALRAVSNIDIDQARALANDYRAAVGVLGETARGITATVP